MAIKYLVWGVTLPWVFALQAVPCQHNIAPIQAPIYYSIIAEVHAPKEQKTNVKKESLFDGQQPITHVIPLEVLSYAHTPPVMSIKDAWPEVEPRAAPLLF